MTARSHQNAYGRTFCIRMILWGLQAFEPQQATKIEVGLYAMHCIDRSIRLSFGTHLPPHSCKIQI